MKKFILGGLMSLCSFAANAQDCDCESNFNWVKTTFEENDAGFEYALSNKGKDAYEQHNAKFLKRVKSIDDTVDCVQTLNEWLRFFRSGHIGISMTSSDNSSTAEPSDEDIIAQFKDSERLDIDVKAFKKYIKSKKTADFEGIWVSEPYKIGIKKMGDRYVGFIIEADGVYWRPGQVKFKINADNSSVYYMRDHSGQTFEKTELLGNNYIQAGFITLERVDSQFERLPKVASYYKSISANDPYFELLDDNTAYIRIPSFNGLKKPAIDSVINANRATILKTPNLIIDILNNGGGSDRSYSELLPIMYTNPIRTVGMELLSTPTNNQRMIDFQTDKYGFSDSEKQWAKESYEKLSQHLGEFVNLNKYSVSLTEYDEVHKYPENIGIIINENNGSTAEQFLLAAKQSKKVKLFGHTTAGVLDISNMYFLPSPCNEFELGYCLSRSFRIPHMAIDDKGIQPDYYIDDNIASPDWISYVSDILNAR